MRRKPRAGRNTRTSNAYVCMTLKQLLAKAFILSSELAKSENRCCVGGSLNVHPPMLKKTFKLGLPCFNDVVFLQRSESPPVISTISKDDEMRPNAKLTCVRVVASI